ncbi:MAG: nuclear transport factor 2 family protein [Chloroflexi bacterium]|nr:nuclear transport factor 2 family protein [Chloroflexota bacterium]
MSDSPDSSAVSVARAHVDAWNHHDFARARTMLAADVHITAVTTLPGAPLADLTGVDAYMQGLIAFAQTLEPGSVRELASVGDARSALLMLAGDTTGVPFGEMTWTGARLYQFDGAGKIKNEHIVFTVVSK